MATLQTMNDPTALPATPPDVRESPFAGAAIVGDPEPELSGNTSAGLSADNLTATVGVIDAPGKVGVGDLTTPLKELQFTSIGDEALDPEVARRLKITYYKHGAGSIRYIFKNGKAAEFVNHIYPTTDPAEIAELDSEAKFLGLTKATGIIDAEELTNPMVALKNSIIREYLAKQGAQRLAANNPENRPGDYTPGRQVNASNTRHAISADAAMAAMASAGSPASSGAELFPVGTAVPAGPQLSALASRMAALRSKSGA